MLARAGEISLDPSTVKITVRRGSEVGEIWFRDLLNNPSNGIPLRAVEKIVLEKTNVTLFRWGILVSVVLDLKHTI